ncbi:hypothetical protein P792_11395 [Asaia sp. SF2.1]|nr:hypothetical protein P792_11395 [Asaia sp. SF2.1]
MHVSLNAKCSRYPERWKENFDFPMTSLIATHAAISMNFTGKIDKICRGSACARLLPVRPVAKTR